MNNLSGLLNDTLNINMTKNIEDIILNLGPVIIAIIAIVFNFLLQKHSDKIQKFNTEKLIYSKDIELLRSYIAQALAIINSSMRNKSSITSIDELFLLQIKMELLINDNNENTKIFKKTFDDTISLMDNTTKNLSTITDNYLELLKLVKIVINDETKLLESTIK